MTPIRRLLKIVQFDLAEKLNLARLRWYHLNHQDQYLQSVIYGNPDNCTLFRLREVLTNLLRANFLSYYRVKKINHSDLPIIWLPVACPLSFEILG